jgi:hypothetical protein
MRVLSGRLLAALLAAVAGRCRGTTIVAAQFEGGVVIGADSHTTTGDAVYNRFTHKVLRMAPRICVARAGNAAGPCRSACARHARAPVRVVYIAPCNDLRAPSRNVRGVAGVAPVPSARTRACSVTTPHPGRFVPLD